MKTFYDLTDEQQERAVLYAKSKILDSLEQNVLISIDPIVLTESRIERTAVQVAEGSYYDEEGNAIEDFNYYGGCV